VDEQYANVDEQYAQGQRELPRFRGLSARRGSARRIPCLRTTQLAFRAMAARSFSFTSESVTEGHPDKVADQISDSVLDAILADDPNGRVACETLVTTGLVVVAGEITTETYVDIRAVVRDRIAEIGYTRAKYGFDYETCGVVVAIDEQSSDIAQGVDESYEAQHGDTDPLDLVGAGDQGMMFGYATSETDELMPLPILLAHKLAKRLAEVRKADVLPYLRPDGKTQVTVRYEVDEHGIQRPVEIERVLISTQHRDGLDVETMLKPDLLEHVVEPILHADHRDLFDPSRLGAKDFLYVNPTGKFVIGGPMGDTGLTGRKIVVDTYGGAAPHGGGAFSGKDPTKVDRSAAYAARHVAKNVVGAGLAERCQLQVAYAIGVAHPMSLNVECFGTEKIALDRIEDLVREHFDLRPAAIIRDLDLLRPIYAKTAAYGHFGRDDRDFTWERLDKVDALRAGAGLLSESQV
jgi:S-adenosylmethionine synthetase